MLPNTFTPSPEAAAIAQEIERVHSEAAAYKIETVDQRAAALEALGKIKGFAKKLEEQRKSVIDPMRELVKTINGWFETPGGKLDKAEANLKAAILTFDREQERIRQEAQRRADEEARKERERIAREAAVAEAKAREQAAAAEAAAAKAREEGRLADAARHEAKAEAVVARAEEKAANLGAIAAAVVAPVVAPTVTTKGTGTSKRKVWKFVIENPALVPDEYKKIDETKIGGVVRALGENAVGKISGVRVYSEEVLAARATA